MQEAHQRPSNVVPIPTVSAKVLDAFADFVGTTAPNYSHAEKSLAWLAWQHQQAKIDQLERELVALGGRLA